MSDNKINLSIKIAEIKELEFFADERVVINDMNELDFDLTVSYHFYQKEEIIIFEVVPLFSKKGEVKQPFLRNKAVTVFQILDLKKHKINQSNLPDNAGVTMLSMAITHARALLAKSASGTRFKNFLIPIVNPTELYHSLKEQSLKEKGTSV